MKNFIKFSILSVFVSLLYLPAEVFAAEIDFENLSASERYLIETGLYQNTNMEIDRESPPYHLFEPYDQNSREGFIEKRIDNKRYLVRVRSGILHEANYGSVVDLKFLLTLIPGYTSSTTETVTTTASTTYEYNASLEIGLADILDILSLTTNFSISYSTTKTTSHTITKGTTFSWYSGWDPAITVNIYSGMARDRFELTIDYVPYVPRDANCVGRCVILRVQCARQCESRSCLGACYDNYYYCVSRCPGAYWDYNNMIINTAYLDLPHHTLVYIKTY